MTLANGSGGAPRATCHAADPSEARPVAAAGAGGGTGVKGAAVAAGSRYRYESFEASSACRAMSSSTVFGSAPGATALPMFRLMVLLTWSQEGSSTG